MVRRKTGWATVSEASGTAKGKTRARNGRPTTAVATRAIPIRALVPIPIPKYTASESVTMPMTPRTTR